MNNKLDFKKIGYRIQHFRLQNKMTQEQLAELVGTTQKHLSRSIELLNDLLLYPLYFVTLLILLLVL